MRKSIERSKTMSGVPKEKKCLKTPKIKKLSLKTVKKKAWDVFSQYIRRKYADQFGNCACVTCGVVKPWKEMQAGHFVDGGNNTVKYDERLVHPQCFKCNMKLPGCMAGNKVQYTLFMARKYCLTLDQIKELDDLKWNKKQMKAWEHLEVFDKYSKLLKEMA